MIRPNATSFLADVPRANIDTNDQSHQLSWESAFRRSRWFERGWTLQELIAPKLVEFFSNDCKLLGDKKSLERYICEITRIPSKALRGSPLATFSVAERMSWAEIRQTTYEEDIVYSLLGIFDVYMALIYGEGKERAFKRLPGNRDSVAVDIQKFLLESYQGSVIITTWSSQVKIGHLIHIGKLEDVSDSLKILSNTSGREGLRDGEEFSNVCRLQY